MSRETAAEPLSAYRRIFPITERYAWLNHAGVGSTSTRVLERIQAHLQDYAAHCYLHGDVWEENASQARGRCARLVGALPHEIAFIRNTSHGLSLVASGLDWRAGDNVLCAVDEEYPSNVYPWQMLRARGVEVRQVPSPAGRLSVDAFARAGDGRTRLLTVSSVQYASGVRVDLAGLGQLCRDRGWLLNVDGIQSVGCVPTDVKSSGVHFLSADSHKWMLGLCGVGFLFVDEAVLDRVTPSLVGWKSTVDAWNFDQASLNLRSDAQKFEEGTPPYALIEGLGEAVGLLLEVGIERVWQRISSLNDRLIEGLKREGATLISPELHSERGGAVVFRPAAESPAERVEHLLARGVIVSCRRDGVRVSPHFYNTEAELDAVLSTPRVA